MKIAIDNVSPGTSTSAHAKGGMRMYLQNLISGMLEIAPQNEYVLLTPDWNNTFNIPKSPRVKIVELSSVPKGRLRRVLYEQISYPARIKESRCDVFLGLCNSLPLRITGPTAVVIQSTQFQFVPESYSFLQRNYLRFGVKGAVRKADVVITVSEHSKNDIVQWTRVASQKVHAVHHGVGADFSTHQPAKVQQIKDTYGSFVLCVSSFYPYKNIHRLIEAFSFLKKDRKIPHRLLIIGADTAQIKAPDFSAYATSLGIGDAVVFPGRVDHADIAAFYQAADVFTMPSLYETFGLPLIEAMSAGCAVVTSRASCMPEVAGNAAELVDPHDAHSIADGLARVLQQPDWRAELIRRGKKRVEAFSWKTTAQKTLNALNYAVGDI